MQLPTTGLRFFTVYGPWGRPDMAPMKFTKVTLARAKMELLPLQAGDVPDTFADVEDLAAEFHFRPSTSVEEGVARLVAW